MLPENCRQWTQLRQRALVGTVARGTIRIRATFRGVQVWKWEPARWWVCLSREPRQSWRRRCNGISNGQTSDRLTASVFWSKLFTTPCQMQQTFTPGARLIHLLIAGTMTRCSMQSQEQYPQQLTSADTAPGRATSFSWGLWRSHWPQTKSSRRLPVETGSRKTTEDPWTHHPDKTASRLDHLLIGHQPGDCVGAIGRADGTRELAGKIWRPAGEVQSRLLLIAVSSVVEM